ncbi:MAG: hypothetical protein ACMXYA_01125 [Candidatus Woesearchaeota archaeon]
MIQKLCIALVLLCSVAVFAVDNTTEETPVEETDSFTDILDEITADVKDMELPSFLSTLFGNERVEIIIHTTNEENVVYGVITEDNVITQIRDGELENPTIGVQVTEAIVREIFESHDQINTLRKAYEEKEISVKGYGVWNSIKVTAITTITSIVLWFF